MTPFLQKLALVCNECCPTVGVWVEGSEFLVKDNKEFEEILQKFYSGSIKTFIRQLHYYGFSKAEKENGFWTFSHPNFLQEQPQEMLKIKRKHGATDFSLATKDEINSIRDEIIVIEESFMSEMRKIKNQLIVMTELMRARKRRRSELVSSTCSTPRVTLQVDDDLPYILKE